MSVDSTLDKAWERYATLARQMRDEPRLMDDSSHNEAMVLAWATWRDLFLADEPWA